MSRSVEFPGSRVRGEPLSGSDRESHDTQSSLVPSGGSNGTGPRNTLAKSRGARPGRWELLTLLDDERDLQGRRECGLWVRCQECRVSIANDRGETNAILETNLDRNILQMAPLSRRLLTLVLLIACVGLAWSKSRSPSGPCEAAKWTLFELPRQKPASAATPETLEESLPSNPANAPLLHYQLGIRHEKEGEYLEAIIEYRKALSLDASFEEALLELSSRLFHCRQISQAIEEISSFLGRNPKAVRSMRLGSLIHIENQKYEQALAWAREAQELDPGDAYGHHLIGLSLQGLHQNSAAAVEFEKALSLDPRMALTCWKVGSIYSSDSSTFTLAEERFKTALSLGLDHPDLRKDLGAVLLKSGKAEEAAQQLRLAIEKQPELVQAYFLLANACRKLGRTEEAETLLEKFQTLRSAALEDKAAVNEAQALYEDGMEFFSKDEFHEAYLSFKKAVELLPTLDPAYHRLAQIDFLWGNRRAAAAWARRAIELYSLEAEYHFVLARCLEHSDVSSAIASIQQAIELKPDMAEFRNLLGNLLFVKGDYQGAADAYGEAQRLEPDNPAFRLNLSTAAARIAAGKGKQR